MKELNFLAHREPTGDKQFKGANAELRGDGDDVHDFIQGPAATISGRRGSHSSDDGHAHMRVGHEGAANKSYYGNFGESEDEMIDAIDAKYADSEERDEEFAEPAVVDTWAEEQEHFEDNLYALSDGDEGRELDTAEGEIDEQTSFDKLKVTKTEQASFSKQNKYLRREAQDGKHPEKPQYKEVERIDKATIHSAVDELRAQTLAHETDIFDQATEDNDHVDESLAEQNLLKAKEGLKEHYFKKDGHVQRYPTLKEK